MNTYKRYIVLAFMDYYPCGGLGDILDDFDSKEDAIQRAKLCKFDNAQVVDRDTWQEVWEK